jgi:hypothetical protein
VLALICTALSVVYYPFAAWVTETPFEGDISLSATTEVHETVRLPLAETYYLILVVPNGGRTNGPVGGEFGGNSRAGGGTLPNAGAVISSEWSLTDADGNLVAGRQVNSQALSNGAGDSSDLIVDRIEVKPGRYEFRFRVLGAPIELNDQPLRVVIRQESVKGAQTWQTTAVFVGSIVIPGLILPAAVLFSAIWVGLVLYNKKRP